MGALLEVKNLNVYYGVIHALKDVSFHVNKGEVVALIGANGAGKTTTLHTLSGLLRPQSGSILYQDKEIARMPAGMNPNETKELMDTIELIRDKFGITILLIEHDMKLVSGICEKLTVLNFGRILAEGDTKTVLSNPEVVKSYLGDE